MRTTRTIALAAVAFAVLGAAPLLAQPSVDSSITGGAGWPGTGGSRSGPTPGTPGSLRQETEGRDVTGTTIPATGSANRDVRRPAGAETGIAPGTESGIQPQGPYQGTR